MYQPKRDKTKSVLLSALTVAVPQVWQQKLNSHSLRGCREGRGRAEIWEPYLHCLLSGALIPPLSVSVSVFWQWESLCAAALARLHTLAFLFLLPRPPDAALRLVPGRAKSCKTNLCVLPPFLSLPPCLYSSPLAGLLLH